MFKTIGITFGVIVLAGVTLILIHHAKNSIPTVPAPIATATTTLQQVSPGDYSFSIVTPDKLTRNYIVHIPTGYTPSKAYPVLFGFHGGGGTAKQFELSSGFSGLADQRGFIVVYCNGTKYPPLELAVWNGGDCCGKAVNSKDNIDDVTFVRRVLAQIETQYNIDKSRVYVTGMSNGGILSNRLACEASDIIAGAAIVSGTIQVPTCTPARQIPILLIHGTADTNVPYYGGYSGGLVNATFMPVETEFAQWGARNGCTGAVITTPIPPLENTDGHTVDLLSFPSCAQPTLLYRINGGIHEWPSGNPNANAPGKPDPSKALDASVTILNFFHL